MGRQSRPHLDLVKAALDRDGISADIFMGTAVCRLAWKTNPCKSDCEAAFHPNEDTALSDGDAVCSRAGIGRGVEV